MSQQLVEKRCDLKPLTILVFKKLDQHRKRQFSKRKKMIKKLDAQFPLNMDVVKKQPGLLHAIATDLSVTRETVRRHLLKIQVAGLVKEEKDRWTIIHNH